MNPFSALIDFIKINIENRKLTWTMGYSTLKKHYGGSMLGWGWAVIKNAFYIFLYWFAIEVGIRGRSPMTLADGSEVPFIIWMLPGITAWFFFRDSLSSGVSCIRKESYLVNRVVFPISTIPVFTELSYFITHIVTLVLVTIVFLVSGQPLTIYMLQLPYYLILYFIFGCIVITFVSTIGAISRDFEQLIKSITIAFFWLAPVLWDINKVSTPLYRTILQLNPYIYFVNGYRDCFLGQAWFYEHVYYTCYIYGFMLIAALITAYINKKLQPEFADVL